MRTGQSEVAARQFVWHEELSPLERAKDWLRRWGGRGSVTILLIAGLVLAAQRDALAVGLVLVTGGILGAVYLWVREVDLDLMSVTVENRGTSVVHVTIAVDQVLEHPAIRNAFQRLQATGRTPPEVTFDLWRSSLLDRFREAKGITGTAEAVETVEFRVSQGRLWVNGQERPNVILTHEVLIPDESLRSPVAKQRSARDTSGESTSGARDFDGLKIRLRVLNGVLSLQVGEWTTETAGVVRPVTWRSEVWWLAWDTITTFPLIFCPQRHFLSDRALILGWFDRDWFSASWEKERSAFRQRARDYKLQVVLDQSAGFGVRDRTRARFDAWLEREGFAGSWGGHWGPWFRNSYMRVFLQAPFDSDAYESLKDWRSEEIGGLELGSGQRHRPVVDLGQPHR